MTKYTYRTWYSFNEIKKFEVQKETKKTIWTIDENGFTSQCRKESDRYNFFDTFEEAKNHLITKTKNRIKTYEEHIIRIKNDLEEIKQIKEVK